MIYISFQNFTLEAGYQSKFEIANKVDKFQTYSRRIRIRENQKQSRDIGIRDPHFRAVYQIIRSIFFRFGF